MFLFICASVKVSFVVRTASHFAAPCFSFSVVIDGPYRFKAGKLSRQGVPLARIDRRQTGDQQIPRIGEKPLQLLTGNFAVLQLRAESRQLRRPAAADELA